MAVRKVTLEDVSEKLDAIHETLRSLKLSCSCPTAEDIKIRFFDVSRILLRVVPTPPLLFTIDLKSDDAWVGPDFYTHPRGYRMGMVIPRFDYKEKNYRDLFVNFFMWE